IPAVDLTSAAPLEACPDTTPIEDARDKRHLGSAVDFGADCALLDGREEAATTTREVLTRTTRALQRSPSRITFECPDLLLPGCGSVLPVRDAQRRTRESRALGAGSDARGWRWGDAEQKRAGEHNDRAAHVSATSPLTQRSRVPKSAQLRACTTSCHAPSTGSGV